MAEIFLGDLSQVKLFDIFRPLLDGKKTGVLVLRGKEKGEIYLELGNIVHARTQDSTGEFAFYTIMGWKSGKITFEPDVPPPERTISPPTEQLLLNWSSRKEEWEKIKEMIASPYTVFRLSLQKNPGDRNISADQWNVLALCNGARPISEISKTLQWDHFKTGKIIYHMVQEGLLERVEPKPVKKKLVGENLFLTLEIELKRVMGPVAPFIIEDKLTEFGETPKSFPQDKWLAFIDSIGEEIPNEEKRRAFLKVMKETLHLTREEGLVERVNLD